MIVFEPSGTEPGAVFFSRLWEEKFRQIFKCVFLYFSVRIIGTRENRQGEFVFVASGIHDCDLHKRPQTLVISAQNMYNYAA
jgi:hypothetical protein